MFFAFGLAIFLSIFTTVFVHRTLSAGHHPHLWGRSVALLATGVILWMLAGIVSAWLAWPLVRLARITHAFGEGELDRRANVPVHAPEEIRELGRAFDMMADRISTQIRGQRDLMAAVSHELRTPLARLRVVLELARESGADERRIVEAEAEIEAMDLLVGSLLAGARIDAGAISLRHEDLVVIAREAVVRASEADTGRTFALEHDADRVVANVDGALVARGLAILIDNAVKHGGPNIIVRVKQGAFLEVEDDGAGISESDRARVFEPFVRGEGKAYDERRGVGLGLALLKRIADAHQAATYAEPGVGSHGPRVGFGPLPVVRESAP